MLHIDYTAYLACLLQIIYQNNFKDAKLLDDASRFDFLKLKDTEYYTSA